MSRIEKIAHKAHRSLPRGIKPAGILFLGLILFASCHNKPRETEPVSLMAPETGNPGDIISRDLHEVVVEEVQPAGNYVYLKVAEGPHRYWIASSNRGALRGNSYYYREALLKTNFKSKITGQRFDTLYLVTQLVPKSHALGGLNEN